jgi:type VI secretion system secreted protein VgrG
LTIKAGSNFITIDPSGVAISGMPMVQINSAGSALSGTAGSLVSALSPTDAADASDADPGAVTSVTPGTAATPASMSLQDIPPATPGRKSAASNAPTHDPNADANKDKTHFIELQLVDESGQPVTGRQFEVKLPDGSYYTGTTDNKGKGRVDNIDPGSCDISFPDLDQDAWAPA